MSLVEVKEFIQKHHHLPNVSVVKKSKSKEDKTKYSIRATTRKIEELFLYTIEQEK